jgi:hypothetical protein
MAGSPPELFLPNRDQASPFLQATRDSHFHDSDHKHPEAGGEDQSDRHSNSIPLPVEFDLEKNDEIGKDLYNFFAGRADHL